MSLINLVFRRVASYLTTIETRLYMVLGIYPRNSEGLVLHDTLDSETRNPSILTVSVEDCNLALDWNPKSANFPTNTSLSLQKSIFDVDILWAVPTHRTSVERRQTRKMAVEKRIKPKCNLSVCNVCGHYHESHTICGNCYEKVRKETTEMQQAIQDTWKLEPVEKDVIVIYDGERNNNEEFWKGKRIVEMKKQRPSWFQHNLRVKTVHLDPKEETSLQLSSKSIISNVK